MKVAEIIKQPALTRSEMKLFALFAEKPDEVFTAEEAGVPAETVKRFVFKYPQHRVFLRSAGGGGPRSLVGSVAAIKTLLKQLPDRTFVK